MKNVDLLKKFVEGATSGKVNNLRIEGDKLWNYGTVIAQRSSGMYVVNVTSYSPTTSKIRNKLLSMLPANQVVSVDFQPMGIGALV